MNLDRIEGNWKQLKGKAKHRWGRLLNDQFLAMEGKRDLLAGIMQEANGISRDAEKMHNPVIGSMSER